MPFRNCLICNNELYVKPSHLKLGWGKYCSTECRIKAQFKGKTVRCYMCNDEVYRSPKYLQRSKSNKFFCSKTCQTLWRNTEMYSGKNHPNWRSGEAAYRRIMIGSERDQLCTICKTNDFRILIGHHIDKNRKNNDLSNLTWLCHNCHYLVHHFDEIKNQLMKLIT